MAIQATLTTDAGESQSLYVRLNNLDQIANHGVPALARFRGFVSKAAFEAGAGYVWERIIPFASDLSETSRPIWKQAYTALVAYDFAGDLLAQLGARNADVARTQALIDAFPKPGDSTSDIDRRAAEARLTELTRQRDAEVADVAALKAQIAVADALTTAIKAATSA